MAMTFKQAANTQYRYKTFYTVWLVGPNGERESLGSMQRRTGAGLMAILCEKGTQERVSRLHGAEGATFKKTKDSLIISNGWKIEFGDTIRQEASK